VTKAAPPICLRRESAWRNGAAPLRLGVELEPHREAARRLVGTPWARERITRIAAALLRC
jgi:hypothetical protein